MEGWSFRHFCDANNGSSGHNFLAYFQITFMVFCVIMPASTRVGPLCMLSLRVLCIIRFMRNCCGTMVFAVPLLVSSPLCKKLFS